MVGLQIGIYMKIKGVAYMKRWLLLVCWHNIFIAKNELAASVKGNVKTLIQQLTSILIFMSFTFLILTFKYF